MRKKRDAEGTKAGVLKSAERLFADRGFDGTSLAEISRASGISDGLILYHFNSKYGLYQAVLEGVSRRYAAMLQSARDDSLPPAAMMHTALEAMFEFWRTDETYHRLSLWAYLEGRGNTAVNEANLTAGLAAYLAALQDSGHFPAEIDPVVFLTTIIGPIHFWFRYRAHFAEILDLKEKDDQLDERFLQQFGAILMSFFKEPGSGGSPKRAEGDG
ncbi:MAG: TetR/AcrR family transcriptional regulator [Anaerolineales bacterium]|nr:TetR/AcrR family transcriptional regulator [Anaerolineales bacterium]